MHVLITGGAGFLGARLARTLLERGHVDGRTIDRLTLADRVAPADAALRDHPRVTCHVADLLEALPTLFADGAARPYDLVFHLASAVSAECEVDFDLGLRANLDTTRALLDTCRAQAGRGHVARLVFSSSVAVYGSDPGLPLPEVVDERTLPTPQSSYGVHKFVCEQLVADYTRKGHLDGRTARLMTVSVRPGRPNGAASSFLSGIVREPLAGLPAVCPVDPDTAVALSSPASAIAGLIAVAEASRDALGGRTALNLPALTVTVRQMLDALAEVAGADVAARVRFEPDAAIAAIVSGWPARFDGRRAASLGLHPDRRFADVIAQYMTDHPGALAPRPPLA